MVPITVGQRSLKNRLSSCATKVDNWIEIDPLVVGGQLIRARMHANETIQAAAYTGQHYVRLMRPSNHLIVLFPRAMNRLLRVLQQELLCPTAADVSRL